MPFFLRMKGKNRIPITVTKRIMRINANMHPLIPDSGIKVSFVIWYPWAKYGLALAIAFDRAALLLPYPVTVVVSAIRYVLFNLEYLFIDEIFSRQY